MSRRFFINIRLSNSRPLPRVTERNRKEKGNRKIVILKKVQHMPEQREKPEILISIEYNATLWMKYFYVYFLGCTKIQVQKYFRAFKCAVGNSTCTTSHKSNKNALHPSISTVELCKLYPLLKTFTLEAICFPIGKFNN